MLATVIIWLQDFNNNGTLNMTPLERETLAAKNTLSIVNTSINDDDDERRSIDEPDNDQSAEQAREVRNRYLKRIGVDNGNASDIEPLLQ